MGLLLLEAGLALFTGVDNYWFPGSARLMMDEGIAYCYSEGISVVLPLNANLESDRKLLIAKTRKWRSDGPPLSLRALLDVAPHCVIVDGDARDRGPAPERLKVVPVFGDSFAYGQGLPDEITVSGFLAALDRQRNFPIFARPGSDISRIGVQERHFRRLASEYGWTCTEALYLYNVDDLVHPSPVPTNLYLLSHPEKEELKADIPWLPSFVERLVSRSRAFRVVSRRLQQAETTESTLEFYKLLYDNSVPDNGRQRSREYLRTLNESFREAGIHLHVVLYPVLAVDDNGAYPLAEVHQTVLRWCAEDGVSCHDAASAVLGSDGAEELILHPCDRHPNDVANSRMARYIYDEVLGGADETGSIASH